MDEREQKLRRWLRRSGRIAAPNKTRAAYLSGYRFTPDLVIDVGVAGGTPQLYGAFPDTPFLLIDPRDEVGSTLTDPPAQYEFLATALGAERGEMTLRIPLTAEGEVGDMAGFQSVTGPLARQITGEITRRVPVRRLDDLMQGRAGRVGLKIDTEGFEEEVLRGAPQTLARCDFVILELSLTQRFERLPAPSGVIGLLAEAGLEIRDILNAPGDGRGGPHPRLMDVLFTPWAGR